MDFENKEQIDKIKLIGPDQFDALYQISVALNSSFLKDNFITDTLDVIIKVLDAERALFVKYDSENNRFSVVGARNLNGENIEDISEFSSGVLQKVLNTRSSQLYHDVQSDPNISQFESIQIHNIKSILGAPVFRGDDIWGIILADSKINRKYFTNENLTFLNFFSNLVSLSLDKIEKFEELQDENTILRNQQSINRVPELIGQSAEMEKLNALIHKVSKTDATVLLLGESGTGKELVAKAIHTLSSRNTKPYLAQFCGSIPDTLLESELFGYKKGAFTGANNDKKGLFEVADKGTFFLDEISDISLALQAKLLRVLQNREIMRLGDTSIIKVDVRVIAATNKDLQQLAKKGIFREDLFYRLNVFPIKIPPLRNRKGDIPLLVKHFIKKFGNEEITISPKALKILEDYSYPGNVRQLENVIQRALILCDNNKLLPEHMLIEDDSPEEINFRGTYKDFEKIILLKRLQEFNGNRTATAQSLGVSVRWVQLKLKEMNYPENIDL